MFRHGVGKHRRKRHGNWDPTKRIKLVTWGRLMHTNVKRARYYRFADWMCHRWRRSEWVHSMDGIKHRKMSLISALDILVKSFRF